MKRTLALALHLLICCSLFAQNPKPFVRWWWNGDRIEADEIKRELRLLHDAGIGGVEINPIELPAGSDTTRTREILWLSDEWIDMLKVAFDEAEALGMECDLIIGSGWPFGAESLPREDRAQVMLTYAEKLEGGSVFEASKYDLLTKVDPGVTVVNPRRTCEVVKILLTPDPLDDLSQVVDLTERFKDEDVIYIDVPQGRHCIYVMSRFESFASVINGAPGASGSILNHMDAAAVRRYLDHMGDAIEARIGPLSNHLRSFFVDSMELEGSNWTSDFAEVFQARRGYDIMPWLPLIMFKVGRLGEVMSYEYGADKTPSFQAQLDRVRFDFELTKAELLHERYTQTFLQWCKEKGVKSRAQAYGRGFFPLESSLGYDIPEGESWTTNWLRHKLGEEMGDEDYRRGRGYTMINKYVSSAANLTGKRIVSSEEMTNTYKVFYTSLEFLKLGSDMGAFSGTTHSVWSGFNYSPAHLQFPGWVRYGSFTNERNPSWPYFHLLNEYRARMSEVLQSSDMVTDIAILPANYDMWSTMGVQTDPFPWKLNVPYTSLLWEAIHKCGGGADYVSELVLEDATVKNGKLCYGTKEYGVLFLPEVESTTPQTMAKLLEFVKDGGRVLCIGAYPHKSLGFKDFEVRDAQIAASLEQLKGCGDRFIFLEKPADGRYLEWYAGIQKQYGLPHSVEIASPDRFLLQNHYRSDDGKDIFLLINAKLKEGMDVDLSFDKSLLRGRTCWVFNPADGTKTILALKDGKAQMRFGPTEAYMLIFDRNSRGKQWKPLPLSGENPFELDSWTVTLQHTQKGLTSRITMEGLKDLQKMEEFSDFMGYANYVTTVNFGSELPRYLNLGKVCEIAEVTVNGKPCGVKWFGDRVFDLKGLLHRGTNTIEVKVTPLTGNYLRTLEDNPNTQRFILGKKAQDVAPMGLLGPVVLY